MGTRGFYKTFANAVPNHARLTSYLARAMTPDAIAANITLPERTTFVATTPDGRVVGFSMLLRGTTEDCLADYGRAVTLERLYVDFDYHGRGVAKLLCMEMDKAARAEGYEHMWVGSWVENLRALAFYAKVGFRKVGHRTFNVEGDIANDYVMLKDL